MRYRDIVRPRSHPYIATLTIDPADLRRIQSLVEDRPELKFLDYDDSKPDLWTVRVACASREVVNRLEDAWG
jgi:hypothetical protein